MPHQLDPERRELAALLGVVDFRNARVLEIGAGDGRLTFRYADSVTFVVGIEPKAESVGWGSRDRS